MPSSHPVQAPVEAGTLIPSTFNPALEKALADKLAVIAQAGGTFGILEALATLLGLVQNSLVPSLGSVHLALVAADHGFAATPSRPTLSTARLLAQLREQRLPLAPLARLHDVEVHVVLASGARARQAGTSDRLPLTVRTTADARRGPAMSSEQAHAALQLGMAESERLGGDALICAALGAGSHTAAALVLGALTQRDPHDLTAEPGTDSQLVEDVRKQHAGLWKTGASRDPVEVLAALGGLEVATSAGLMLGAAARRRLVLVDGVAALAGMQVATRIAPYVRDYCIPVRSHRGRGLGAALALSSRPPLPTPLDLDAMDGSGGVLAVPVLRSAAAMLATRTSSPTE